MSTSPKAPAGLDTRGRKFWAGTTGAYDLSDAELHVLTEVCRTLDTLDRLAAQIATDGVMINGAAGQDVLHPAIGEARAQRVVLHRLLAALALPDEDGEAVPTAGRLRGRTAAQARWAGTTKRGA